MSKLKQFFNLPKTIWGLSLVSMLSNSSSVIISSLSPALIIDILGGTATDLAFIRGITETLGYLVKLFSGMLSDYLGRRKILIIIGYSASAVAKPLYATAGSLIAYFSAQAIDRITNGLRDAPRDAMIAEASPKGEKGSAFGLRQTLSAIGSTVGAISACYLMCHLAGSTEHMVRGAYWFSIIPIATAIVILACMTQDSENVPQLSKRKGFPIKKSDLAQLGSRYWFFIFVVLIFMCARSTESFLILRAKTVGLEAKFHPIILGVLYFFAAIFAKTTGSMSDKLNKKTFAILGFLLAIISYLILAYAESIFVVFVSVAIYGIHYGISQTVIFAMVSEYAPKQIKATSFGILNLICALGMFVASLSQGKIWDICGPHSVYLTAASVSLISLILLFFIKSPKIEE